MENSSPSIKIYILSTAVNSAVFIYIKFNKCSHYIYNFNVYLRKYRFEGRGFIMKYKIKKILRKYVENGKIENVLYKINGKIKMKKGKDYSKYINKIMRKLKKI